MVYVWARRNPHVRMSFLGLFSFHAPYLPWVLLSFSVLLGNSATIDLIGIVVGHVYYFLEDVYPMIADIRGWRVRRWLAAPMLLKMMFGEGGGDTGGARLNVMAAPPIAPVAPVAPGVEGENVPVAIGEENEGGAQGGGDEQGELVQPAH